MRDSLAYAQAPKRRFDGALQTGPYKRPDYRNQNNNTYRAVTKNGKTSGIDIESTQYNILITVSNEHNAGTTAPVRLRLKGDKGITKPIAINSTSGVNLERGSSRELEVQCKNVGELSWIWLENKGTGKEDGLLLSSIQISQPSTEKVWFFSIGKWLSRHDGERLSIRDFRGKAVQMTHYRVTVVTGNFAGAGTDSRVSLIMYGQVGESPQFLLTSPDRRGLFAPGAVSKFIIPFSNLGDISRVKVSRDGSGSNSGWFLKRIIVEDPTRPRSCYLFNCNDWISLNKHDDVSHSQVIQNEESVDFNEHEYHVTFYNSAVQRAGTTSDVFLKLYGRDGADRERWFNNQQYQFRVDGATNQIKLRTRERLGDLSKVKVGLEAKGNSPGWLLDKWIIPDRDGAPVSRYLPLEDSKDPSPVIPEQKFEMTLFTKCDRPVMGKLTDVFFRLFGPKEKNFDERAFNKSIKMGNFSPPNRRCSPIICIPGEQLKPTGESVFKFTVNGCHRLSPSSKLSLGHDAPQKSSDWFVEKVMLYCLNTGITQIFHCKKWFPFTDNEVKRKIGPQYTVTPSKRPPAINNADWQVEVYTSEMRDAGTTAPVYMTLYGNQGKTDEIWLNEAYSADKDAFFDRGSCRIFKLNLPPVGDLSKLRIRHDATTTSPDWYLEKVIIQHLTTRKSYLFTCNRWLGVGDNTTSNICEIPVSESNGDQPLSGANYTIHTMTGEMLKADTNSNLYISLLGDAGKTQFIPLKHSQSPSDPFRLGQEDIFQFEAPFIEKAKILLERKDSETSWYLKNLSVTVNEFSLRYPFTVEKWLSLSQYEDKKEFILQPESVERLFRAVPYEITFYTGSESGSGTDALVFLQLYGNKGAKKTETLLFGPDAKAFATGGTDTFNVYTSEVGDITKIRVGHNGKEPSANWFLEKIRIRKIATHFCAHCFLEVCPNMRISQKLAANKPQKCNNNRCDCHLETKKTPEEAPLLTLEDRPLEEYWFFANGWLPPRDIANGQNFCELPPASADQAPLSDRIETVYEIRVRTSSKPGAGTTSQAYITLIGDNSESGDFVLHNPQGQILTQDREAIFRVEAIDLGKINKIRLRHDNTGTSPDWHIQDVTVIESTGDNEREYLFNCNQWLIASPSGSDHLIKEFLVSQTKQLQASGRSIHINEYVNGNSSIVRKNRFLSTNSSFNKDRPSKQGKFLNIAHRIKLVPSLIRLNG
ncbi:unnamed protein product [Hymenolepis diminuta]|uniref:PLAT domain-containing protein n=1 Tax=Hymenolepis diminuta TaxID=6216 RepID=A0A158QD01_HYMDI|nr:unnamed protein product [Hymenolepis diminuta]